VAQAQTAVQRARAAISLGRLLAYQGAGDQAVEMIESAAGELGAHDAELRGLAERELLATATVSYAARRRLDTHITEWGAAHQPPESSFDRLACAAQAVDTISAGRPVADCVELANLALPRVLAPAIWGATYVCWWPTR
jgi:hypothetical protein